MSRGRERNETGEESEVVVDRNPLGGGHNVGWIGDGSVSKEEPKPG